MSLAVATADIKPADHRLELLDWMATQSIFEVSIQENEIRLQEKYHRFAIKAGSSGEAPIHGFGRATDKVTAATIASAECIERYVSRKLHRERAVRATDRVVFEGGLIKPAPCLKSIPGPSKGLHSSNGWAVHFSRETAIQNAAREALERHILLLNFLKLGWRGFQFTKPVAFQGRTVTQGIAQAAVAGFGAGIVLTQGAEAPGATFGYICERRETIETSTRWLGAFFESHEQWVDITNRSASQDRSVLESYQRHYLHRSVPIHDGNVPKLIAQPVLNASLAVFDLQEVLNTKFPLFAAFVFGGDLIPLFLKQKLNEFEIEYVKDQLAKNGCELSELPEFHPIL